MNDDITVDFADFTEQSYRSILVDLVQNYEVLPFGATSDRPHALWRHDVDCSVHRALRLAEIEHDLGVQATYFFLLHSEFYNLLEDTVLKTARRILALGHNAGLHFDLSIYNFTDGDVAALEEKLEFERSFLEGVLDAPVEAFSFHNPEIGNALQYGQDRLAGMISAYGRRLRSTYFYVSDSNGVWRFSRIPDVVREAGETRLHVLTHPVWWTEDAIAPRAKIDRCIDGRARATNRFYDRLLDKEGRPNIK